MCALPRAWLGGFTLGKIMSKQIQLSKGKIAIVDDDVFSTASKIKWNAHKGHKNKWYAVTKIQGKSIFLHNFVMLPPKGFVVDHINGDGLDNRRENLRIASYSQNSANRGTDIDNKSGYKGVIKIKNKWAAKLNYKRKTIYIGSFDTAELAARAYDEKAREIWGEFSQTNF